MKQIIAQINPDYRLTYLAITEWQRIQERLAKIEKLIAKRQQEQEHD